MLRRAGLLAALAALLVPAMAGTATADAAKRKKQRTPVVKTITPKHVFVGETLTIRGRRFRPGVNKNTVAFKRRGAKAVFVKAEKGTRKLLKVTLPKRLEKALKVVNGTPVPTRLKVRVLAKKFGKRFTRNGRSPIVGPEKPPAPPTPPVADPDADCDGDGQVNRVDTDDDNDLLTDDVEKALKLNACNSDSDGDGVSDGYEHSSARDLNDDEFENPFNDFLPYPEKRPYPNALDATDAGTDHDGDSLTLKEEYELWKISGTYSAGEQYSLSTRGADGRREPAPRADGYDKQAQFLAAIAGRYNPVWLAHVGTDLFDTVDKPADWWAPRTAYDIRDLNRSGGALSDAERLYYDDGNDFLDDGERDEDADGLSNFDETRGCMNRELWNGLYDKETPYPIAFAPTSHVDWDSDGDGVHDGADDQDHDDVPNIMECSRLLATGLAENTDDTPHGGLPAAGFVNPFNPCLPHVKSRTCKRYVDIGTPWAPFNPDDVYYLVKN